MVCEARAVKVPSGRNSEEDLKAAKTTSFLTIREMFNLVRQGIPFWIEDSKNNRRLAEAYCITAKEYLNEIERLGGIIAELEAKLQCMSGKYGREKQLREAAEAKLAQAEKVQRRFDRLDSANDIVGGLLSDFAGKTEKQFAELSRLVQDERSDMQDALLLEIWKASDNGYKTADLRTSNRLADIFTAAAMAAKGEL